MELAKTSGSLVDIKDDFIIAYIDYAARGESIASRYEVYPSEIHIIESMGMWSSKDNGTPYYFKGFKAKIKNPKKIKSIEMLIDIYQNETGDLPIQPKESPTPSAQKDQHPPIKYTRHSERGIHWN